MASIFTKIINREIPGYIIAEDDRFIAFLDIMPVTLGHTLVVPKIEVDYIFDLDSSTLNGLLAFAKPIARAIEEVVPCLRIGLSVVGLEVPHAHLHLIPLNSIEEMSFTQARIPVSADELSGLSLAIKERLNN
jgi:histidine triad (HIT) family protein